MEGKGRITKEKEYAILTNDMTRAWSGMSVQEYKQVKGQKNRMTFLPFRPVWGVFWLERVIINCLRPEMGAFGPERLWHALPQTPKSRKLCESCAIWQRKRLKHSFQPFVLLL